MPSLTYEQHVGVDPALAPTNAHGAQVSGAEGEALQQLGQQGTRLLSDMKSVKEQQDEADAVAHLQSNISSGYRNFSQYLEEQQGKVPENGAGYTENFTKAYGDWQSQLVDQQPSPRTKRMAAEQARTLGDHFFTKALSWENETRRSWRTGQLDNSITGGAAVIDADPSTFEPMLRDTTANIDAVSADLHTQQGRELKEKAVRTYSQAAALSWARSHPQDTINAIQPSQPLPTGGIPEQITTAAKSKGVDPQAALAIAQFESHLDPTARPIDKKTGKLLSSAGGIYQQTDDNWTDYGNGKDRFDPAASIDAGVRFMADNQHAFKDTFRRDPTIPELYSMHLLGMGGGFALAKAPNDLPFEKLVGQYDPQHSATIAANNSFSGLTVGQVKAKIGGWMNDATLRTAGLAKAATNTGEEDSNTQPGDLPWLQHLMPAERQAMLTHAQSNLRKDDAGARAIIDQQSNDATAQLQNGVMPARVPSFDDYVKAGYPAVQAAQKSQQMQSWQNYGAQYAKFATATPAEMTQILSEMRPVAGDGYDLKLDQYNHAVNAVQQIQRQRTEDPIQHDQASGSLNLTQALDPSKPDYLTAQLKTRMLQAEQVSRIFGTPYAPLTKQDAMNIGQKISEEDAQTALQDLASIRRNSPTAQHFTAAMAQIAPTHPILGVAAQLAQNDPQTALMVLKGDRILNPGKAGADVEGKTHVPMPDAGKFAALWETERGAAYTGISDTSRDDLSAAIAYYAATVKPGERNAKEVDTETFKTAMKMVSPVGADPSGKMVIIPAGSDPTQFADNIHAAWPSTLQAHGLDPKDYPISAYGLVSAGEDGRYVPVSGTGPLVINHRKVVIDLNQPPQAAVAQPPPAQPRQLKGKQLTLADMKMAARFK